MASTSDLIEIPDSIRDQHIYVPGKTRHGKSTLFHAMAYQDIKNGHGVCVIDPKGDLVQSLLHWIPEERKDDCIYFSMQKPVPIDFMSYPPELKAKLVGDLKFVVTRGLDANAAPLMDAIIENLIYTLLNANEHPELNKPENFKYRCTFLDIHRFLKNERRREFIREFVTDDELNAEWDVMPTAKECAPTLTRMNRFVRNPVLRRIFECPDPELKIADVMNQGKILLVNLAPLSEESKTVATLLIGKIRQAALERAGPDDEVLPKPRIPFRLYADEFQFYQTSDFDEILSFAGGYGLHLTLANQYFSKLSSEIQGAIDGNVGSFIIFKIGSKDRNSFAHIAQPYDSQSLLELPKYQALYKIGDRLAIIKPTPAPPPAPKHSYAGYIRTRTLDLYSCKSDPRRHNPDSGKPEPEGTLLPNEAEAAGSRPAGPVLRPPKQGSRTPPPKPRPEPNRHSNDKPDA